MSRQPSLFLSHGSPMLLVQQSSGRAFLEGFGAELTRPEMILIASAHWMTETPAVGGAATLETIYDFFGFPPPLYEISYTPPGAPALAGRAVELLEAAGFQPLNDDARGLDHGSWVPLRYIYPAADIPIAQVSIQPHLGPAHHLRIGAALEGLRDEGVLVIGSGQMSHNLYEMDRNAPEQPVAAWAGEFCTWMGDALREHRWDDLVDYRQRAPFAERNHPTDEHLLPLFIALGAGGKKAEPRCVHSSFAGGTMSMDSYVFVSS